MTDSNTTIYNLDVTRADRAFSFAVRVADNGIWDLVGADNFRATVGEAEFSEWLLDFWKSVRSSARAFDTFDRSQREHFER